MNKETRKPRILYVLGLAYSGSTLFGISIGRHSKVLNFGEIVNLENDYNPSTRCTCGEQLKNCSFWTKTKKSLGKQQKNLNTELQWHLTIEGERSFLEKKSDLSRLKVLLGDSVDDVYGVLKSEAYLRRNEEFFSTIKSTFPYSELIIDLSKTHERLEILAKSNKLDIWVLYLTRDAYSVFYSNIKRPKMSRRKWGPKILREAYLQRLRTTGCERAFNRVNPEKRFKVSYEDFTVNPSAIINGILEKIGVEAEPIDYTKEFNLQKSGQHIYVGNRWLFSESARKVKINSPQELPELPLIYRFIARIFLGKQVKAKA